MCIYIIYIHIYIHAFIYLYIHKNTPGLHQCPCLDGANVHLGHECWRNQSMDTGAVRGRRQHYQEIVCTHICSKSPLAQNP